ncbi:hypothetical protein COU61_02035 [Candidatus Pacearchaeota archaeon CG10_big_fil_rev_8_21_14_0_10_35_13]|nr:MAG: hypothetical protein COU61_02035 [Candidatus Pacearchaeota archaeon CG10_big_fil_rev_8_21_14_0_10_35_13]
MVKNNFLSYVMVVSGLGMVCAGVSINSPDASRRLPVPDGYAFNSQSLPGGNVPVSLDPYSLRLHNLYSTLFSGSDVRKSDVRKSSVLDDLLQK